MCILTFGEGHVKFTCEAKCYYSFVTIVYIYLKKTLEQKYSRVVLLVGQKSQTLVPWEIYFDICLQSVHEMS